MINPPPLTHTHADAQPTPKLYTANRTKATASTKRWLNVRSWCTFALIGISTGLIAFVLDTCVEKLLEVKYEATVPFVEAKEYGAGYGVFISISLGFGLISTLLVNFGETVAAGSGIPEVKGYVEEQRAERGGEEKG